MKKNILNKLALIASLPLVMLACDGDDESGLSVDFASIATTYHENAGTVTLPLRNAAGATSGLEVVFGGTAVEGEDFTFEGITEEGVQIDIINDTQFEENETIRVQIAGANLNGNSIHTVTIINTCDDTDGLDDLFFAADFDATEIYAPDDTWGPYTMTLVQDEEDENKYWMDNFWDSGLDAYLVYDPATKTISFPQQVPLATFPTRIITSEPATVTSNCNITITTHYRGYTWSYEFIRHQMATE